MFVDGAICFYVRARIGRCVCDGALGKAKGALFFPG